MKVRFILVTAAVAAAAFALGHLHARPASGQVVLDLRHDPSPDGAVVATFAEDAITAEELRGRLSQMSPLARARYRSMEQKREYLEGLLRFELLALEARVRGLASDADVRETTKKVMVQRLLQTVLDSERAEPSDEELAEYYQRHKQDYVRPERLRLSHIFLAAPRSDPARAAARRKEAEALLAQLREAPPQDFRTFGALAVAHTDDLRTRPLEGDLRFLSLEELSAQLGPEVAEAAAALDALGDTSGVVETDRGFHILKLRSREPALSQDFESARPMLLSRLGYERRTQRYEALLAALREKWNVEIDVAALAAVEVDPSAPAEPIRGPPPGFIPAPARPAAAAGAEPPVRAVMPESDASEGKVTRPRPLDPAPRGSP